MPASAQRVIALTSREDADLKEIVAALAGDPALTAEVLRVANSSAFGYSRKVANLGHAVMTIGFRELHNMTVAMALLAAFRSKDELSLHLHDYGLLAGAIAQRVGKEFRSLDSGATFLSGLLSEIGAMACLAVDARGYVQIWKATFDAWDGRTLDVWAERSHQEAERYGASTPDIGARLLRRNLVPEAIAASVEGSTTSDPSSLTDQGRVTAFSRVLSVVIVRAGQAMKPELLGELVPAVAERVQLTTVAHDKLIQHCLDTAAAAERWARNHR